MTELHFPWLGLSVLCSLIGAITVGQVREPTMARSWSAVFAGSSLLCTSAAWLDFQLQGGIQAYDRWHFLSDLFGAEIFVLDQISAPLLPLVALLHFLTVLTTLRTKIPRFSFTWTLASESILLATFCCKEPWFVIAFLAAGTVPPFLEMQAQGKSTRIYVLHMALFISLMVIGGAFVPIDQSQPNRSSWSIMLLAGAVLVRNGIVPFQCWVTDLFEHSTYGTSLLCVTPIAGAYAAVRLVLPIAPEWVLRGMGFLSLITAVYAAGMGLIQRDARRFLAYLILSHSAFVLVGLEIATPIAVTGALCVWMSVGLALGGFGLTLRALESRYGRLSLTEFQGHYVYTPNLAMCFALTGLASVGFPGTFGFIGTELLVDGAVEAYPYIGIAVVVAAALNGISVMQAYFRLFTGTTYVSTVPLKIRTRERYAVLTLAALILLGGLFPQFEVAGRYRAATELLKSRAEVSEDSWKNGGLEH